MAIRRQSSPVTRATEAICQARNIRAAETAILIFANAACQPVRMDRVEKFTPRDEISISN